MGGETCVPGFRTTNHRGLDATPFVQHRRRHEHLDVRCRVGVRRVAATALFLAPRLGLVLVGVVLASHAVWDAVHYRRDQVVPRSLAEFCMMLDVPLGVGFVVLAVLG